jgi:demethylmenaquinone methyltransferase/2-methoxy-6-polyprenyl-1,4-benzoquinol methylase
MLTRAAERVASAGWQNVTLLHSAVEDVELPGAADAALLVLTHDVLRSERAIDNLLSHLRPGARVSMAGGKWLSPWLAPANLYMWLEARPYITAFEGFRRPWDRIARRLPDLRVETFLAGAGYVAWGTRL